MEVTAKQLSKPPFRIQKLKESSRTFVLLRAGLSLGYYRGRWAQGTWTARRFLIGTKYEFQKLGLADDQGKADGLTVLDFDQASEKALAWARAKEAVLRGETIPGDYSVAQLMLDYIADRERTKRRTLDRTRQSVTKHIIGSPLGTMQVQNLRHHHLEAWLNDLGTPKRKRKGATDSEDAQRAQSTANRQWTNLRAGLGYGFKKGRLSTKVWERISPFKGVDQPKVRFLDQTECARLIAACTGDFKLIAQGALYTAARYGELCAMRVGDYDPTINKLHIQPENEKSGKGRHITLNPEGAAFFKKVCEGREPDDFVFMHTSGELKGKPWAHSNQRHPLNLACDAAKIKPRIGFHILRKSVGAHLAKSGVPLQYIANLLGHSSIRMTEKHYGHLCESHVSETLRLKMPSFQ